MHNEHNPVAQIIYRMQALWRQKIMPDTALVRWLLKADEHRMYEGFCRLEASPHGAVDELFVFFYTPFESAATFSRDIIQHWLKEINDEGNKAMLEKAATSIQIPDWRHFEKEPAEGYDTLLIQLMAAFRELSPAPVRPLVLSILPNSISSPAAFAQWISNFAAQQIPAGLRLLVFDHTEGNYWGSIFEKYGSRAITLYEDLQLDAAIREIATGGDARQPDVQFRRCMYAMGDAASKKQLTVLHQWGNKAIEVGTKSGQKTLLATAYITYAGMLFTFKEHALIHQLLDNGIGVCKQAVAMGDAAAISLLLQFYGYKAAAFQHQKETKPAMEWFLRQGREAKQYGLYTQSVAAYHKAFLMAQFNRRYEDQAMALEEALQNTPFLHADEIQSSEFPYIVYEYLQLQGMNLTKENEKAGAAVQKMESIYGTAWKETVRQLKANFNKQEIEIKEAAARAV